MKQLDQESIKIFYENTPEVWPKDNAWYSYLRSRIDTYIRKKCKSFNNAHILNAGSGGNSYGIVSDNMYHVDIAKNKIADMKNAVVANIEKLPFSDAMFDYVICVGSVIDYCDAAASIAEMSRVIKKHGMLILEFENSFSFEYLGRKEYGKSAEIVNTKYMDQSHYLWVYSFDYIKRILSEFSFIIRNFSAFHILSSLHLNKHNDEEASAKFARFDNILQYISYFKKHASNIILFCEKL
jgi:ubiquinone/menaquinone biosynthesis C-methylase UbiE